MHDALAYLSIYTLHVPSSFSSLNIFYSISAQYHPFDTGRYCASHSVQEKCAELVASRHHTKYTSPSVDPIHLSVVTQPRRCFFVTCINFVRLPKQRGRLGTSACVCGWCYVGIHVHTGHPHARTYAHARTQARARWRESNPTVIPLWRVARIQISKSVVYDRTPVVGGNVSVHH